MSDETPAGLSAASFDSNMFRQVLGRYPTGVTVVTADGDEGPVGMAIGSFASVSLDPPLVMFCPAKTSNSWPGIESAGHFCVNILALDQQDLCATFAGKDPDKFDGVDWTTLDTGAPVLEGCVAWIDCTIQTVHEAGDHWIVVGLVENLSIGREVSPLLFFAGGYGHFEN